MKKLMAVFAAGIFLLSAAACGKQAESNGNETNNQSANGGEKVQMYKDAVLVPSNVDRMIYEDFENLEKSSDLVVVGEFVNETHQVLKYMDEENKKYLYDAVSDNMFKITKVLKGDKSVNDEVKVSQRYGYCEQDGVKTLAAFSGLTPMNKGDKWILFLFYDEAEETYWVTGDFTGRYPVPDGKTKTQSDSAEVLGLFETGEFNSKLYEEILERYKLG